MRTSIPDLDNVLREALAHRIGTDLYREATAISPKTVEAVSPAVSRLASNSDQGNLVAEGFSEAMMSDGAIMPTLIEIPQTCSLKFPTF